MSTNQPYENHARIVESLCSGIQNDAVIQALLDCAWPGVKFHSSRFGLDENEVLQELMLRLLQNNWERLRSWNRQSSLTTWLGVVTYNLCFNIANSARVKYSKATVNLESDLGDHSRGVDEITRALDLKLDFPYLLAVINKLPGDQAYVLLQRHYVGRTPEDIAQELSKTAGNINVICFRAIQALRELLGGLS